jgi:anti-sigma B factor antagonist
MSLQISHAQIAPSVVAVSVAGKLMLGPDGEQVVSLVDTLLGEGQRTIIFDLSELNSIDSTGIGRFIASYNKIVAAGGEMRMAGATGHLFQSFHVSMLDQVFPFYASVDEAAKG